LRARRCRGGGRPIIFVRSPLYYWMVILISTEHRCQVLGISTNTGSPVGLGCGLPDALNSSYEQNVRKMPRNRKFTKSTSNGISEVATWSGFAMASRQLSHSADLGFRKNVISLLFASTGYLWHTKCPPAPPRGCGISCPTV
jgi:hypothetical protein